MIYENQMHKNKIKNLKNEENKLQNLSLHQLWKDVKEEKKCWSFIKILTTTVTSKLTIYIKILSSFLYILKIK